MFNRISKYQAATATAVFFHLIGITGILFFDRSYFVGATAFNLLLTFALIIWTQPSKNISFFIFLALCFITGMAVEIAGVNTGMLFGDYHYGNVLGPKLAGVPLIIGINWFIIIYCCGISIHSLLTKILEKAPIVAGKQTNTIRALSIMVDGATMAVFFDWVMEPVAVKLGYWQWLGNGNIPFFNYICWFGVSVVLLGAFHWLPFSKNNKFAINLLLIQLMFFLLLRTFL